MGLTSLNAALSGLKISQQQISLISTNVANVGTYGYTRKILPQSAQSIQGQTIGVFGNTIGRNVDLNLTRDLWTQVTAVDNLTIKQNYLGKVNQFHGPPDQELSVAAELSQLRDSLSQLSDSPENTSRLNIAVNQARDTANKINELATYLNTLRNDAQNETESTVASINTLLEQIASLNTQIRSNLNLDQTTAALEDERDNAIQELSGLIDISFFQQGDGVLVIQTNEGVELASDIAQTLTFNPRAQSATTYYPASAAGVFVGDPANNNVSAVDITGRSPGGKLGGLLELRDEIFPRQVAQLDEMAHKLALRLDAQGLRLFTDGSGNIPADTPPDPTTNPPTPVAYVGFASTIRVNQAILNDYSLLQKGTYGATTPTGSSEVIRRALEFGFGSIDYQQIANIDAATSVDLQNTGGATLQNWLGLVSQNTVQGTRNLSAYLSAADLVTSANGTLNPPSDVFRITFEEPDLGLGPVNIDISLAAVPNGAGNLTQDIIAYITGTLIPALPAGDQADLTAMNATFSVGANGQLKIDSNADISLDASVVTNGMGPDNLALLGFGEATTEAVDPYFDIRVGNGASTRITLEPTDDITDLLNKLNAVPGVAAQITAGGFLQIRPGNSFTNPDFGGDIRITGGPFSTNGATLAAPPALSGRTSIANGVNISSALFGTYSVLGSGAIQNESPVTDVEYQSETAVGSGEFVSFRQDFLGPGASISTGVVGATRVQDFGQKMINQQTQELIAIESSIQDNDALREILQKQLQDESGVNLDEELGNLIVVQTAYAASARVVNAVNDLFDELLNSFR